MSGTGAATNAPPPPDPNRDNVTLTIAGQAFGGWQEVRITRGIEIMPNNFDLVLTELYPGQASKIDIQPGQAVVVKIGADVVITGYVDRYQGSIGPEAQQVRISGRGRCQDLVDCAAGFKRDGSHDMAVNVPDALTLAQRMCAPFGISVTRLSPENSLPLFTFMINFGESPFEIIDRTCRYRALLAYEGADGNLILAQAGNTHMATGFVQGQNIERASVMFGMDQRFSDYWILWTTTDTMTQIAGATGATSGVSHGHVTDTAYPVPRFRPRAIVSEQVMPGVDIGQKRAEWEKNRRNGRSQVVTLTCDSWRDGAGTLWQPNALVLVHIPACKITNQTWIIAEVTYRTGEEGTHADLVLMPAGAFEPEPTGLQGVGPQIYLSQQGGGGAQTSAPASPAIEQAST